MTVYESDLPGVGKKFEIELDEDDRLVIVTHNTGKREVFRRRGDEDSEKLFELSDRLARQVGSVLEGAYFQPIATETTETMLGDDTLLEWVAVEPGSELAGRTLEDLALRRETGATVVAIQRDDETMSNPGSDTAIETGDTLVVLGTRDAFEAVSSLAGGGAAWDRDAAGESVDDGTESTGDDGVDRGDDA